MKFFKPKFWDKNKISFFSIVLLPATLLIKALTLFKKLFIKKHQFSIPIICVGNIYLGGTGKTPLCIEIFSILKRLKKKPAFIRKKYKSYEDESYMEQEIGPTYESKKRANALNNAIQNKIDIAILDDGFQDQSIKKNMSIICFNEKQWIGNGLTIPSGPLRENLSALNRANCIVIYGKKNINIENKILENNKLIKIFYAKYKPQNINEFENKKIISFAGIGNPNNFFELLKKNRIDVLEEISFPDHYQYSKKDLDKLIEKSEKNNAILVTTEKDYYRINGEYKKNILYLKIKTEIEEEKEFIEEIKKII